jgi:hypothetical protein
MDIDKEKNKILFDLFKNELISFIDKEFKVCKDFKDKLYISQNEREIKNVFIDYKDDVYEKLGGELFDNQEDEIDDLKDDIRDLEIEVNDLENQLDTLGYYSRTSSLNDEYKIKFFMEHKDKYTPWELEELLKDGKNSELKTLREEIEELNDCKIRLEEEIYELKDKLNEL